VFWDVAPYSLVEVYQYFRGTYCLYQAKCNIPEDSHLHTVIFGGKEAVEKIQGLPAV
jgi:hypothetical protein